MESKNLKGLHPFEYEHPFDQKALDALQNMPGLEMIIRKFNSAAIEPLIKVQYTGSHTRITKEFYPTIYGLLDKACSVLNLDYRPLLYTRRNDEINAFTVGVENPIIVINTGTIELCSEDELLYIIGHEIGHIKSRHTLYHQVGDFLPVMADMITGLGSLITFPLQLALFRWARMSEFTADRAGLLACQNFASACRMMMKAAGVPSNYYKEMQIEAFIEQAREFELLDYEKLNQAIKFLSVMDSSHPWLVMRAAELIKWVESGEYENVLERNSSYKAFVNGENGSFSCKSCGQQYSDIPNFCNSCGKPLKYVEHG